MNDCRWTGQWMSTALYANYKCQHYAPMNVTGVHKDKCGEINCVVSDGNRHDRWVAKIVGCRCNVIERVDGKYL